VHAARLLPGKRAVERFVPWAAALAVAGPILVARYPPMIDLPCHEEIVAAMRHFGDRARYPQGLMTWNLGHPNQLFYFLACALAWLLPVAAACKVLVAASVAAVPLAAGHLACHLRVSRWVAVSVAPLGLGFFFYFGLVGNLLSLGLLIAFLPLLDRFATAPSLGRACAATLTLLLLYEAHDSAVAIASLAILVFSLGGPLVWSAIAWRAAPLAVGAGLGIAEEAYVVRHAGSNLLGLPRFIDLAMWQKIDGLPQALLGLHGEATTRPAFFLVLAVLAMLAGHRIWGAGRPPYEERLRRWLHAHRFEVLGVLLIALYFEVPFSFAGAMWLHARFLTPGVALLAIALGPRLPGSMPVATRTCSVLALGAVLALVGPEMAATGAVYADLDRILWRVAVGSAIAPLDVAGGPWRGLVFTTAGAAARASAERGGRMAASFTQASPIPPVIVAPEHRWENSLARMAADSMSMQPATDLRRFRYVLTWAQPGQEDDVERALLPEARLLARSGGWRLFESTIAVESLLSMEPSPDNAESVRVRLDAFARAKGESNGRP
jgi:hypothetical protein